MLLLLSLVYSLSSCSEYAWPPQRLTSIITMLSYHVALRLSFRKWLILYFHIRTQILKSWDKTLLSSWLQSGIIIVNTWWQSCTIIFGLWGDHSHTLLFLSSLPLQLTKREAILKQTGSFGWGSSIFFTYSGRKEWRKACVSKGTSMSVHVRRKLMITRVCKSIVQPYKGC